MRFVDPTGLFNLETFEVQEGDTLSEIAVTLSNETGLDLSAEHLANTNGIKDPDMIYPGDVINNIVPEIVTGTEGPSISNNSGITNILAKPLDVAMDPMGPLLDSAKTGLQNKFSGPLPNSFQLGPINLKTTQAIGLAEASIGAAGMTRSLIQAKNMTSGTKNLNYIQGMKVVDNFMGSAGIFAFGVNQFFSDEIKNPIDAFKPPVMSAVE